jgi:hypothetical protein
VLEVEFGDGIIDGMAGTGGVLELELFGDGVIVGTTVAGVLELEIGEELSDGTNDGMPDG